VKTIFICVYIEKKKTLQNQQAHFNHPWVKGKFKIVEIKGQFLFKGEIIREMQKIAEVIEKLSP
jgi:hypothetical protein